MPSYFTLLPSKVNYTVSPVSRGLAHMPLMCRGTIEGLILSFFCIRKKGSLLSSNYANNSKDARHPSSDPISGWA